MNKNIQKHVRAAAEMPQLFARKEKQNLTIVYPLQKRVLTRGKKEVILQKQCGNDNIKSQEA